MDDWLSRAADALATDGNVPRDRLELDGPQADTLLDLARIAAHDSGDRRNAPLLCYLIGLSATGGKSLDELAELARRSTS